MGPLSGGTTPAGHCSKVSRLKILCLVISRGEAEVTDARAANAANSKVL